MTSKDQPPLPLADILRDLALLRAADNDLAGVLPPGSDGAAKRDEAASAAVQRSYEFAKEARAVVRMHTRGDLDGAGGELERVREGLEEVLKGLEGAS